MELFVCLELDGRQIRRLNGLPGIDRVHVAGDCLARDYPPDTFLRCEVVLGNPPFPWLSEADALRWIQLESTGFDEYLPLGGKPAGSSPAITNLEGFFAEPVAETCVAGILALCRGIDEVTRCKESRTWKGDALRTQLRMVDGAQVVLFGYGAINRRVQELLRPFGCTFSAFRSNWRSEQLVAALSAADMVVCACPDTARTQNVFDRRRLSVLKQSAIFVNVGRGGLVDENALADALEDGRLGGALLDVTREEPLPPSSRLWHCPNLILSQHSGGGTVDEINRKLKVFSENLHRYREGRTLKGLIDLKRGY